MLTSKPSTDPNHYGSMRSVRSFLSSLNQAPLPESFLRDEAAAAKPVKTLHLSPSIQCNSQISPALWMWIHCQDTIRQELLERIPFRNEVALQRATLTKLYTFTGEATKIPEYLAQLNLKDPQTLLGTREEGSFKPVKPAGQRPAARDAKKSYAICSRDVF